MLEDPSYRIRYDEDAGPVQRPYSITDGRTQPDIALELESLVCATGDVPDRLDPMLEEVLHLSIGGSGRRGLRAPGNAHHGDQDTTI